MNQNRILSIAGAALLATLTTACSGSPMGTSPLAPSAVTATGFALDTGDTADATFGALGNDKGKGKDKDGTATTTPTAPTTTVEVEGAVVTATGTCPAKTITIGTQSITTNAATVYEDGVCADLVALAAVEVTATRQADGTLVAARVDFAVDGEDDDDGEGDDDESEEGRGNPHHGAGPHSGTVSSFRGACPVVTFNLKGLRISTTAATTYEGGTCETLRPNVQVTVTGTAGTGTRTFVAETITITRTPNVRTR